MPTKESSPQDQLTEKRKTIDQIDLSLVNAMGAMLLSHDKLQRNFGAFFNFLLAARFLETDEVGRIKREHDIKPMQHDRYAQVLENVKSHAEQPGLSHVNVGQIVAYWELIHATSIDRQESISDMGNPMEPVTG